MGEILFVGYKKQCLHIIILFYHDNADFMTLSMDQWGILESESNPNISTVLQPGYVMLNLGKRCLLRFKPPLLVSYIICVYTACYVNHMYFPTTLGVLKHMAEASVKT